MGDAYPGSGPGMHPDPIAFDAFGTLFDLEALREPMGDAVFEGFVERLRPWRRRVNAAGVFLPLNEIAQLAVVAAGAPESEADELVAELARLPCFPDVVP